MKKSSRPIIALAACLWLFGVGAGIRVLWNYELSPGKGGPSPVDWPVGTFLQRASDRATLVMALHPRCPCSRATVGELAELMAQSRELVSAYVLFYQPHGGDENWVKTDLWKRAAAIPGVTLVADVDSREARRFGAVTSGQTSLYDTQGHLLFNGGITLARGHAGNNPGRSAVVSLVHQRTSTISATPVFGCSLFEQPPEARNSTTY